MFFSRLNKYAHFPKQWLLRPHIGPDPSVYKNARISALDGVLHISDENIMVIVSNDNVMHPYRWYVHPTLMFSRSIH